MGFCLVLSTFSANQDWFSMITVQVRNRGHTGQLVERGRYLEYVRYDINGTICNII